MCHFGRGSQRPSSQLAAYPSHTCPIGANSVSPTLPCPTQPANTSILCLVDTELRSPFSHPSTGSRHNWSPVTLITYCLHLHPTWTQQSHSQPLLEPPSLQAFPDLGAFALVIAPFLECSFSSCPPGMFLTRPLLASCLLPYFIFSFTFSSFAFTASPLPTEG